jgi:hypothetical protein
MNDGASDDAEIPLPLRGVPTEGWRWQDNELSCLFQPIIGPAASALYCHLTGKAYNDKVIFTLRGLAAETKRSRTTVWRALAVLINIGMVRIRAGGGNQESECSLVNLKKLAVRLGASHNKRAASYMLTPSRVEELRSQIEALLSAMQAKHEAGQGSKITSRENLVHSSGANFFLLDSKRNARVSLEKRQWPTRETQTGSHLLLQNTRLQNSPTPTPSRDCQAQHPKNYSNEDEPDELVRRARVKFTGVMKDMESHLLDTSRSPNSHLANGFADWQEFGFNSLAVEAATWRGKVLALTLSASDPAAARRGLVKYRRTWDASLRKWYECEVLVELQQAQRKW